MAPVTIKQIALQTSYPDRLVPIYVMELLLYIFVLFYGVNIQMAVAAEKNSRVQEILIASVKPDTIMYGKLAGTGLVGLTQYSILLVSAFTVYKLTESGGETILFSHLPLYIIILFGAYFFLGYLLYATLYAALASLVSRVEDVAPLTQPVTMVFLFSFIVSIMALQAPNTTWIKVLSYIPFFTPTVMFARIGMSNVQSWQIGLSLILLVASTTLSAILSAKVYRVGVLLYGKRPSFKEIVIFLRQRQRLVFQKKYCCIFVDLIIDVGAIFD
ncbi:hypothetical protein BM613_13420 [Sulfoacidibacillus thermotolerans]|uniref:ABC-2 type transporter transmembrane domain-containing protein n=1 Tax=Sulfoacidibacillus thermotolerans TaxID=1765684 RepID=A0A2U3D1M9_SULT2|nr:hypothetical protein BM613_13420 [Sulfoacidibacillus thermotolerans]